MAKFSQGKEDVARARCELDTLRCAISGSTGTKWQEMYHLVKSGLTPLEALDIVMKVFAAATKGRASKNKREGNKIFILDNDIYRGCASLSFSEDGAKRLCLTMYGTLLRPGTLHKKCQISSRCLAEALATLSQSGNENLLVRSGGYRYDCQYRISDLAQMVEAKFKSHGLSADIDGLSEKICCYRVLQVERPPKKIQPAVRSRPLLVDEINAMESSGGDTCSSSDSREGPSREVDWRSRFDPDQDYFDRKHDSQITLKLEAFDVTRYLCLDNGYEPCLLRSPMSGFPVQVIAPCVIPVPNSVYAGRIYLDGVLYELCHPTRFGYNIIGLEATGDGPFNGQSAPFNVQVPRKYHDDPELYAVIRKYRLRDKYLTLIGQHVCAAWAIMLQVSFKVERKWHDGICETLFKTILERQSFEADIIEKSTQNFRKILIKMSNSENTSVPGGDGINEKSIDSDGRHTGTNGKVGGTSNGKDTRGNGNNIGNIAKKTANLGVVSKDSPILKDESIENEEDKISDGALIKRYLWNWLNRKLPKHIPVVGEYYEHVKKAFANVDRQPLPMHVSLFSFFADAHGRTPGAVAWGNQGAASLENGGRSGMDSENAFGNTNLVGQSGTNLKQLILQDPKRHEFASAKNAIVSGDPALLALPQILSSALAQVLFQGVEVLTADDFRLVHINWDDLPRSFTNPANCIVKITGNPVSKFRFEGFSYRVLIASNMVKTPNAGPKGSNVDPKIITASLNQEYSEVAGWILNGESTYWSADANFVLCKQPWSIKNGNGDRSFGYDNGRFENDNGGFGIGSLGGSTLDNVEFGEFQSANENGLGLVAAGWGIVLASDLKDRTLGKKTKQIKLLASCAEDNWWTVTENHSQNPDLYVENELQESLMPRWTEYSYPGENAGAADISNPFYSPNLYPTSLDAAVRSKNRNVVVKPVLIDGETFGKSGANANGNGVGGNRQSFLVSTRKADDVFGDIVVNIASYRKTRASPHNLSDFTRISTFANQVIKALVDQFNVNRFSISTQVCTELEMLVAEKIAQKVYFDVEQEKSVVAPTVTVPEELIGRRVIIHGLKSETKLNGKTGRIIAWQRANVKDGTKLEDGTRLGSEQQPTGSLGSLLHPSVVDGLYLVAIRDSASDADGYVSPGNRGNGYMSSGTSNMSDLEQREILVRPAHLRHPGFGTVVTSTIPRRSTNKLRAQVKAIVAKRKMKKLMKKKASITKKVSNAENANIDIEVGEAKMQNSVTDRFEDIYGEDVSRKFANGNLVSWNASENIVFPIEKGNSLSTDDSRDATGESSSGSDREEKGMTDIFSHYAGFTVANEESCEILERHSVPNNQLLVALKKHCVEKHYTGFVVDTSRFVASPDRDRLETDVRVIFTRCEMGERAKDEPLLKRQEACEIYILRPSICWGQFQGGDGTKCFDNNEGSKSCVATGKTVLELADSTCAALEKNVPTALQQQNLVANCPTKKYLFSPEGRRKYSGTSIRKGARRATSPSATNQRRPSSSSSATDDHIGMNDVPSLNMHPFLDPDELHKRQVNINERVTRKIRNFNSPERKPILDTPTRQKVRRALESVLYEAVEDCLVGIDRELYEIQNDVSLLLNHQDNVFHSNPSNLGVSNLAGAALSSFNPPSRSATLGAASSSSTHLGGAFADVTPGAKRRASSPSARLERHAVKTSTNPNVRGCNVMIETLQRRKHALENLLSNGSLCDKIIDQFESTLHRNLKDGSEQVKMLHGLIGERLLDLLLFISCVRTHGSKACGPGLGVSLEDREDLAYNLGTNIVDETGSVIPLRPIGFREALNIRNSFFSHVNMSGGTGDRDVALSKEAEIGQKILLNGYGKLLLDTLAHALKEVEIADPEGCKGNFFGVTRKHSPVIRGKTRNKKAVKKDADADDGMGYDDGDGVLGTHPITGKPSFSGLYDSVSVLSLVERATGCPTSAGNAISPLGSKSASKNALPRTPTASENTILEKPLQGASVPTSLGNGFSQPQSVGTQAGAAQSEAAQAGVKAKMKAVQKSATKKRRPRPKGAVCLTWLQGKCSAGAKCQYQHFDFANTARLSLRDLESDDELIIE